MSLDIVIKLLERENEKPPGDKNENLGNFLVKVRDSRFEDLNYLRVKSVHEGKNLASRLVITEMIKRLNTELKELGGRVNLDEHGNDEGKDKSNNRRDNEKENAASPKSEKPSKKEVGPRTNKRVGEKK